ncbi:MAG: DUF4252 domain-containing protein [Cyclobacteriaceae bacterium]|nr:DUF4252 domain-containing protein [Cyclobacteriaceae bacterium HetDA_MAG_MS6]
MKRTIIAITMMAIASGVFAQGAIISKYFDQFSNNDEYVKVSVSSKMFSLFTELEPDTEEEKDFLEAISKLKGLKMIMGDSVTDAAKLYSKAIADVDKAGYEELMTVKDAEENIKFSIKDSNGIIQELIMVGGGKNDFVILSLFGEIDLKNISKLAKTMKVDGLSRLKKLDED